MTSDIVQMTGQGETASKLRGLESFDWSNLMEEARSEASRQPHRRQHF